MWPVALCFSGYPVWFSARPFLVDVSTSRGNFLQIQNKCLFGLRGELIRFWRSVVKVLMASRSCEQDISEMPGGNLFKLDLDSRFDYYITELNWFEWSEAKFTQISWKLIFVGHDSTVYTKYKTVYDKMFYTNV